MLANTATRHIATRDELIDFGKQTADVFLSDIDAARRHLSDPRNPLYIGISGLNGGGKSLFADALCAGLCPERADEILKPRTDVRPDLETVQTNLADLPIEIQFKNLRQSLTRSGIFGLQQTVYEQHAQLKCIGKQRTHGGITFLQNYNGDILHKKILSVSFNVNGLNENTTRTLKRLSRRGARTRESLTDTWDRRVDVVLKGQKMQEFSGFFEYWRSLESSDCSL
jgi:hypothetical protein